MTSDRTWQEKGAMAVSPETSQGLPTVTTARDRFHPAIDACIAKGAGWYTPAIDEYAVLSVIPNAFGAPMFGKASWQDSAGMMVLYESQVGVVGAVGSGALESLADCAA